MTEEKTATEETLKVLVRWSIREWSLQPELLLTLSLLNFRNGRSAVNGRKRARVSFVGPKRVEFRQISREFGQEVQIERASVRSSSDDVTIFDIDTSHGGKIVVTARTIFVLFF